MKIPARCVSLALLAAAAVLGVSESHGQYYWQVPSGDSGDWSNPANWGGTLPTGSDAAYIVNGGTATVTQLGETCGTLSLGSATGSGTIVMTDGGLSTTWNENIGDNSGSGSFTQSRGTNAVGGNGLYLSAGGGGGHGHL